MTRTRIKVKLRNKEISWLSFNARLLQEAVDPAVPLIERIKFLGIFSSNLDEFFRVRVATLKRLSALGKKSVKIIGEDAREILAEIDRIVLSQQSDFNKIYQQILRELALEKIFIINEHQLNPEQIEFTQNYFRQEVRPQLIPLMIDQMEEFPELKDRSIYLAIQLSSAKTPGQKKYTMIELPSTGVVPRFLSLPRMGDNQYIILLDDVIRFALGDIFAILEYERFEAYTIKLTRDAEMDIDDDYSESLLRKVSKGLVQRKFGSPVRFVFDEQIPEKLLKFILKKLHLNKDELSLTPGGRYHNFKDFMKFPDIGNRKLLYKRPRPLPHRLIDRRKSLLASIEQQDILLHYPYQTFDYVIDFLREAAIDSQVISIKITLYRVAKKSQVINALINAAKNGKNVTVIMELQARFDEEANIYWSNRLREEGVKVIHSMPRFKVHAKLILITRKKSRKETLYACIGTGNFNESTARLYSDHSLFTCDIRLTKEVKRVLDALDINFNRPLFRHLLVAPYNMRTKLLKLIDNEIKNAGKSEPAYITVKLNNLTDPALIKKLYEASQAGVPVKLMVRGMFSLVTKAKGMSENIQATGTIDKYLEHSRLFVFCAGGNEKYYLSSADWMPRNLDKRMEVACPVYDPEIQQEIKDFLDIHWKENVKARILNKNLDNQYKSFKNGKPAARIQAQEIFFEYCRMKLFPEDPLNETNGDDPEFSGGSEIAYVKDFM